MSNKNTSSLDAGLCSLLTVLFGGLKLTGFITWSWLWVLSPMWVPFATVLVIMAIALFIAGIVTLFTAIFK